MTYFTVHTARCVGTEPIFEVTHTYRLVLRTARCVGTEPVFEVTHTYCLVLHTARCVGTEPVFEVTYCVVLHILGLCSCLMQENKDPEAVRRRAMQDPEIQQIIADPAMQLILQQMQKDPQALREYVSHYVSVSLAAFEKSFRLLVPINEIGGWS